MTNNVKSLLLISSGVLALALSGCQSTSQTANSADIVDKALMQAADQATAGGITAENLKLLENIYKRNPKDPQGAIRFARGLRDINETTKASMILEPFVKDPNAPEALKLEYAAIQLEAGRYEIAERTARDVIKQNADSGFAYHLLGTALDAQGLHQSSEEAFRQALDHWIGDPVPVMNNLALSLTAQEKLEEAHDLLVRAKEMDPSRLEIERNLRIVNALRETVAYKPSHGRNDPSLPVDITTNH